MSGAGTAYGPEGMDAYLTKKSVFLPAPDDQYVQRP